MTQKSAQKSNIFQKYSKKDSKKVNLLKKVTQKRSLLKNLLNKVLKKVLKKVAFPKNTQKSRVLLKKVEIFKNCFNNFLLTEFFEKIVTRFILCRSQSFVIYMRS